MSNSPYKNHVFHEGATGVGVGNIFSVPAMVDLCKLDVVASEETTFTVEIKVKGVDESDWKPIAFVNDTTCSIITNSTIIDASANYSIPLRGTSSLRVEITAIDGELSIYGRMVG
jgi:hypothetical protein